MRDIAKKQKNAKKTFKKILNENKQKFNNELNGVFRKQEKKRKLQKQKEKSVEEKKKIGEKRKKQE